MLYAFEINCCTHNRNCEFSLDTPYEPEMPTENTKIYAIASGKWIELGNYANGQPLETRSFYLSRPIPVDAIAIAQEQPNRQLTICFVEIFA